MPPHQLVVRACGSTMVCAGRTAIAGDTHAATWTMLRARVAVARGLHHTSAHAASGNAQCHASGPRTAIPSAGSACVPTAWMQCSSAGHRAWVNPMVRALCTRPGGGDGGTHMTSAARGDKASAVPHAFGPSPPAGLAAGDGSGAAEKEDDEEKERSRLAYVDSVSSFTVVCDGICLDKLITVSISCSLRV